MLIHRCIGKIWIAALGQALVLALLGWHEFSFIQSNGTNGYMIGLSCCYLSIAAVTTGETWFYRRLVSKLLKVCVLLIAAWASYLAHPQTSYTWLGIIGGVVITGLIRLWGIRQLLTGFVAISTLATLLANLFELSWFKPVARDWPGLVNAGEVTLIRLPAKILWVTSVAAAILRPSVWILAYINIGKHGSSRLNKSQ